jgi:cytochrome c oxidase subunit 3
MSTTTTDVHSHDGGHGEHEHNPYHQHHFATMEQQFDTSKLGMWLFLATEILLFGGLFVGFGLMQHRYPREFIEAHEHLKQDLFGRPFPLYGAINTIVLLVSSWTMVMGVNAAQTDQKKKTVRYLVLTILLACVFLGIKYVEYQHKFHDGLLPGIFYAHQAEDLIKGTHGYATFFSFYFMMTGLHGIHVLVGIGLLGWLVMRARRGEFSKAYYTPVDLVGLYWHIVDMIWIYLFPLYYLIS